MSQRISGLVIARNEQHDLPECLDAWGSLCDRIVLVDDNSSDDTVDIARSYGCDVIKTSMDPATGFSGLRNTGLERIDTPLALVFDADERPTLGLSKAIEGVSDNEAAYRVHRRNHAFGRHLQHGRFSGDYQTRLFPSYIRYSGIVHETPQIPENMPMHTLEGDVEHFTYRSITEYVAKMRQYAMQVANEQGQTPTLATICRERAYSIVKRRGYRDGWPAAVITLGDTLHDLMVMNEASKNSLTGDAYIGSAQQRAFDIVAATGLLALGAPVFGGAALAIGINHRSTDVMLRQRRIGANGNMLNIYKMRTIPGEDRSETQEATGPYHPEATWLGNQIRLIGIDEYPQFLEVLEGTMNVRGIRPQTETTLEQRRHADPKLFDDWYEWAIRNPGILGPGQAYAHRARSYREGSAVIREVMRIDIRACETASLTNDIRHTFGIPLKMAKLLLGS